MAQISRFLRPQGHIVTRAGFKRHRIYLYPHLYLSEPMATVTATLRSSKVNASGTAPIYLRVADRDASRYVSLGIRVRPKDWLDAKGRVRKTHPDAESLNAIIAERVATAEREVLRLKTDRIDASASDIKAALKPERRVAGDFLSFADMIADELDARGQHYLYKRYKSVFGKLRSFTGSPLPFERVTPELLRRYETHLHTHFGNNANTALTNFNVIRAVLYRAIKEGHADQGKNPFFQFQPTTPKRPQRGKLTLDEVRALEALALVPGSMHWHARNYFLFSFYCAGIRFGDFARLTQDQIKAEGQDANGVEILRLSYRMNKTGTLKSIRLVPQARHILSLYPPRPDSPYVFPLLDGRDVSTPRKLVSATSSRNVLVNRALQDIASQAGIKTHISFHIARHSFADVARAKGRSVYDISKALGHANLKVTETYLKGFDTGAVDDMMEDLFS